MSQMLPDTGEGMRRAACPDASIAPLNTSSDNKELLRRQLLSSSKERNADRCDSTKVKHTRSRQKNRWKLKFHHQALPQEYLDHYEQSLQKTGAKKKTVDKPKEQSDIKTENSFTNETFKIWAQRLAGVQSGAPAGPAPAARPGDDAKRKAPVVAPAKVMTYDDLPYMGEMTLNNSKPRRGRKPKKADICHLIYENYGTVVGGRPPPERPSASETAPAPPRTDLHNRIISSLLERKLGARSPPHRDREPLNLCLRDLRGLTLQGRGETPNAISVIQRAESAPPPPAAAPPAKPAKRKRSAIFIPPLGAGSGSAAPGAEVSICKFKFTGGSKPSLQEKKMLSVDSGGNFRYYSGGAAADGGCDFPQGAAPAPSAARPPADERRERLRKRKSRKTLQRERLERTFREKGFLIQTSQLQSAEGATYCKFRQLRKFTRYLFRSWRDYLPGLDADAAAPPSGLPTH